MGQDCIFCRIAAHELPAAIVHEDDDVIAFRDLDPRAPVHVLIIPKRHIASVNDVTDADAPLMGRLFVVARALAAAEAVTGYRLVMNTGTEAGQSVAHVHLHLLGGRPMKWPPG